jgi:hypothetical protein
MTHREFIRNYLILRLIPISVSSPKTQKRRYSLFFSLLARNSTRQRPVWQGRLTLRVRFGAYPESARRRPEKVGFPTN